MAYQKISTKTPRFIIKDVPVEYMKNGVYVDDVVSIRYRHMMAFISLQDKNGADVEALHNCLRDVFNIKEDDIVDIDELFELMMQIMQLLQEDKPTASPTR